MPALTAQKPYSCHLRLTTAFTSSSIATSRGHPPTNPSSTDFRVASIPSLPAKGKGAPCGPAQSLESPEITTSLSQFTLFNTFQKIPEKSSTSMSTSTIIRRREAVSHPLLQSACITWRAWPGCSFSIATMAAPWNMPSIGRHISRIAGTANLMKRKHHPFHRFGNVAVFHGRTADDGRRKDRLPAAGYARDPHDREIPGRRVKAGVIAECPSWSNGLEFDLSLDDQFSTGWNSQRN